MQKLLLNSFYDYFCDVVLSDSPLKAHVSLRALYRRKLEAQPPVSIPFSNGITITESPSAMMGRLLLCALASGNRHEASIPSDDEGVCCVRIYG